MQFISQRTLPGLALESRFTRDGVSGILWTPPGTSSGVPAPLILLGQPGGFSLERMYPRLAARAASAAEQGFASAALELPGAGERAPLRGVNAARAELIQALAGGGRPTPDVVDRLILPLVDLAVPEWQGLLDDLLLLPDIGDRVGFSGGVIAIGIRLAATDARIAAAGLYADSYVPSQTMDEASSVTIPVHMLLQWDDEGNDRGMALDLFDAIASKEKSLLANMGGHTGVPEWAGESAVGFFARHLAPGAPVRG